MGVRDTSTGAEDREDGAISVIRSVQISPIPLSWPACWPDNLLSGLHTVST